ncbi:MAG TPA: sigma-54 dependent transcriptional regulator [Polyangiaceae bacterium LLY-WYZ-14_1]|nr:sigma-54 dependent transcriptional regulator [Polyangiaceae bacterium LLY-WYZ-14_1]
MLTAHGNERVAVEAMKRGAWDYFRKPFEVDELLAVVRRALEAAELVVEKRALESELVLARHMVFVSPGMRRLARLVGRVGPRDVTVLIQGESGTGKELVANALVRSSRRAEGPFVRFNCAAVPRELADAELFGHARGAFTGAVKERPGLFRAAHGGTLLLDEVGELDLATQAKLLRVLQEGEVRPVGEDRTHPVDVRLIAATHRNLPERVAEGSFREDLYYRLAVVTLPIPPLRERPDDIEPLARHFLHRAFDRFELPPVEPPTTLFRWLRSRDWPGNVRELANAMESLVAMSEEGGALDLDLLEPPPGGTAPAGSLPSDRGELAGARAAGGDRRSWAGRRDAGSAPGPGLREKLRAYEQTLLEEALAASRGNQAEAARRLRIGKATLHDKLRKHGLIGRG